MGCVLFSIVYILFPFTHSLWIFGLLFFIYGIYAAANDGIARAWISNLSHKSQTASALGFYTSLASIFTMLASIAGGLLWDKFGPQATFLLPGIGTLLLVVYLLFTKIKNADEVTA